MPRSLDELADAYPNPQHQQQRVFNALLEAIEDGDSATAAEAAAQLAQQLEREDMNIVLREDEDDSTFGDD